MSYILEALKKSDAERKRGEVPTLSDAPPASASFAPAGRSPIILIAAGVVGFLIVGGVGAWLMLSGDTALAPAQHVAQPTIEEPTAQPLPPEEQHPPAEQASNEQIPSEQSPVEQPLPAPTVMPSEVGLAEPEPAIPEQPAPDTAPKIAAAAPTPTPIVQEAPAQPAPEIVAQPKPKIEPKADAEQKTEPAAVAEPMPEPQEVATLIAKAAPAPTVENNSPPLPEPTLPATVLKPEGKSQATLKSAKVLVDRAWTNMDQGLFSQALADLDQAIISDPASAEAWFARGWALEKSGDETSAIVDYGRAIDAKPKHAMALFSRGFLQLYGGNPHDAVTDFVRIQGVTTDESLRLYSYLWLYLSRVRAEQNAQERLKNDAADASLTQWPGPLVMHFLGDMNESAVLTFIEQGAQSGLKERRATGYFFLGIAALISGDKDRARTYFEKTLATGAVDFRQYDAAKRELNNLR
jgi:general secretion pathway protein B